MSRKSQYNGKYFSILGDSISTLVGYNPPECAVFYDWGNKCLSDVYTPEDTWWGQVIDALGGQLLVNHSWSGSLVCRHPSCEIESYGCSDARTGALGAEGRTPDVIMILLGLNDRGWGMRITPGGGEDGLSVFSVAYEVMLEKIKRNYPQAEVWCMTLPLSRGGAFQGAVGRRITDYCQAIRACGEKAGCKVVDLYRPEQPYETVDGKHPNAEGMKTIAAAVLDEVRNMAE